MEDIVQMNTLDEDYTCIVCENDIGFWGIPVIEGMFVCISCYVEESIEIFERKGDFSGYSF